MPLTVLSDSDVRSLLLSLSRADVLDLQHNLAEALHQYSTGTNENGCCSMYQPQRISISPKDGQTTLFMPASTSTSIGMKVVTLADAVPSVAPSASSVKSDNTLTPSPSIASSQSTTPRGSLTLFDSTGSPLGLINAEELTAFRTALASSIILYRRSQVQTVTVFGAGKQAFWHIRIALLLRGHDIKRVNIINRSFNRAQSLMQEFYSADHSEWRSDTKFSILSSEFGEYNRLLKEEVRKADVILCCTPAIDPLFPADHLTATEGRKKGRYISAIGSYKPHMCELHPDILKQAVTAAHHHHHHKHAASEGVVVVDSLTACMQEAGEVIQAGLTPEQLVEIGELWMVKKAAMKEIEKGGEGERGLKNWIEKGNIIYKSVGLGLMDICVGEDICRLARERGIGTMIENF
ncbi:hypothetical protein MMC16_007000 [Acarospora aff. strigata]|nr:hypothetical protein [Acarospora aff. strigata]